MWLQLRRGTAGNVVNHPAPCRRVNSCCSESWSHGSKRGLRLLEMLSLNLKEMTWRTIRQTWVTLDRRGSSFIEPRRKLKCHQMDPLFTKHSAFSWYVRRNLKKKCTLTFTCELHLTFGIFCLNLLFSNKETNHDDFNFYTHGLIMWPRA